MPIATTNQIIDEYYYSEEFKTLVRSEREYLLKTSTEMALTDRARVQAFRFDFYRLLRHYKVPQHLWWATAFINGIEDPFSDIRHLMSIKMIEESVLDAAISRSNTTYG